MVDRLKSNWWIVTSDFRQLSIKIGKNSLIKYFFPILGYQNYMVITMVDAVGVMDQFHSHILTRKRRGDNFLPRPYGRGFKLGGIETLGELIEYICQQINYYNNERIHTSLKMTPTQFRNNYQLINTVESTIEKRGT